MVLCPSLGPLAGFYASASSSPRLLPITDWLQTQQHVRRIGSTSVALSPDELPDLTEIWVFDAALAEYGAVGAIARPLFTEYVVPFELVGILLLVAIVGAIVLAKKKV